MKKFIITSAGFAGEVHVVYDHDGKLIELDFRHAELSLQQVDWFKNSVPAHISDGLNHPKLQVIEEQYEIAFDKFWEKYNQKHNRIRAHRAWDRLSKVERARAYFGMVPYLSHLQRQPWKSKADPETYLKNKYWQNEWK